MPKSEYQKVHSVKSNGYLNFRQNVTTASFYHKVRPLPTGICSSHWTSVIKT